MKTFKSLKGNIKHSDVYMHHRNMHLLPKSVCILFYFIYIVADFNFF